MISLPNDTFAAASGLSLAAWTGLQVDRRVPDSGILVTLTTSALIARWLPSQNPLYDLCWSTFLPASLALLLLGLKPEKADTSVVSSIRRVAMPFAVASLGSIVGCLLSFAAAQQRLSVFDARTAVSCLVASLVGGSVNFFATAAQIPGASTSLMSALAASDLITMAFYFAGLSAALQSPMMHRWFGGNLGVEETLEVDTATTSESSLSHWRPVEGALVTALALGVVRFATVFESALSRWIPGTACAVIAALVPRIRLESIGSLGENMRCMATPLSEFFFLLLFASIGLTADLGSALQSGPACLMISSIALSTHMVVTLFGCLGLRRWFPKTQLEDVLIASNAAIGGPATAAAFCGRIKGKPRKGFTMAATFWGVFGYAIGTTLGISMFRGLGYLVG